MSHRNFNGATLNLKLNLRDSFLPANESSYLIGFSDGKVSLGGNISANVEIGIDVADFSSLILGAADFADLYNYSRATISDLTYVDRLDALFRVRHRPVCLTSF